MNKWIAVLAIAFSPPRCRWNAGAAPARRRHELRQAVAVAAAAAGDAAQKQQAPQQAAPAQQPSAAGAPAAAGARAASPWRGALMGLAAGLGLAALASWLGFRRGPCDVPDGGAAGDGRDGAFGMLMRRMRPAQPAYPGGQQAPATWHGAGGPSFNPVPRESPPNTMARAAATVPVVGARPGSAMDELLRSGRSLEEPWASRPASTRPASSGTRAATSVACRARGRPTTSTSGRVHDAGDVHRADARAACARPGRQHEVVTLDARLLASSTTRASTWPACVSPAPCASTASWRPSTRCGT